jgi:ATP-dependent Clp protease ATP-binding subunit ClpC
VYERLTEQGLQAIHLAEEQARTMGHEYLGTEHLLLGLLALRHTSAADTLSGLGVTLPAVRSEAERVIGLGERATAGPIPLTPLAKRALEQTANEAETAGHDLATAEHLLLGLATTRDDLASRILVGMDVSPEQIRTRLASAPID